MGCIPACADGEALDSILLAKVTNRWNTDFGILCDKETGQEVPGDSLHKYRVSKCNLEGTAKC